MSTISQTATLRTSSRRKAMELLAFYAITCLFMACSTWIAGLQWTGANGVSEFLTMIFKDKPYILLSVILIFIISGVHMHIGKAWFGITYFENGVLWLSASWVSFVVLWLSYGLVPNKWEVLSLVVGHVSLMIALIGRVVEA